MEKYYTPEIEEFYSGFKYAYRRALRSKFISCIFGDEEDYCIENIKKDIEKKLIKVKYLDRKDIESLGFVYNDKYNCYNGHNILMKYFDDRTIYIATLDPSKNEFFHRTNVDNYFVNRISIKNKSELKKLLKQLKIIE